MIVSINASDYILVVVYVRTILFARGSAKFIFLQIIREYGISFYMQNAQIPSYTSATVVESVPMCPGSPVYKLVLTPHAPLMQWKAGQFVMLQCVMQKGHFARPFSIASIDYKSITLYIHIRGKETQAIRSLEKGDTLKLWGPLGSSYSPPTVPTLIIAGGIGIAPFLSYTHQYKGKMALLFGHRIAIANYPLHDIEPSVSSQTFHDTSKESLDIFLESIHTHMIAHREGKVIACGPLPLLRYIQSLALQFNIHTELSLEETMFCGVGACLGCVCKTTSEFPVEYAKNSYAQSCTHGPVFLAHHILL